MNNNQELAQKARLTIRHQLILNALCLPLTSAAIAYEVAAGSPSYFMALFAVGFVAAAANVASVVEKLDGGANWRDAA